MTAKTKSGLFYSIWMSAFLIAQSLLMKEVIDSKEIFKSIAGGIIGGMVGGLAFVWINNKYGKLKLKKTNES